MRIRRGPWVALRFLALGLLVAAPQVSIAAPFNITDPYFADPLRSVRIGPGIACRSDSVVGPPSGPIDLTGRPGVPRIAPQDLAKLRRMLRYIHPSYLRFAYLSAMPKGHRFIIFNAAPSALCSQHVFSVLNGSCNEYYEPSDVMFTSTPATSCINPPRPWIQGDRGAKGTSWSYQCSPSAQWC